jgi:hypothetical protein
MMPATARELEQRRHILFSMLTALDYRYPPGREPALIAGLRAWLHGWPGIGRITAGMARQGYDLQLTRYGSEGWRATFFPAGMAHSSRRPSDRAGPESRGPPCSGRRGRASASGRSERSR